MRFYFVGLDMRSPSFDYAQVMAALNLLQGRQVSPRIWMCVVRASQSEHVFGLLRRCLAGGDRMLVEEVPRTLRLPETVAMAA